VKNPLCDDIRDVRLGQRGTVRIRIGVGAGKEQSAGRGLAAGIRIAAVDPEIRRPSEVRYEVRQEDLVVTPVGPVAVPDEIDILGAEQDGSVVVYDPAVVARRAAAGGTVAVLGRGWTRQDGQSERKRDRETCDELRFHGGSPFGLVQGTTISSVSGEP